MRRWVGVRGRVGGEGVKRGCGSCNCILRS